MKGKSLIWKEGITDESLSRSLGEDGIMMMEIMREMMIIIIVSPLIYEILMMNNFIKILSTCR